MPSEVATTAGDDTTSRGERRRRLAALVAVVVAGAAMFAGLAAFLSPEAGSPETYAVAASEITAGAAHWYRPIEMGFDASGVPYGVWLVRSDDGEVLALLARDPHASSRGPCSIGVRDGDRLIRPPRSPATSFGLIVATPLSADAQFEGLCTGSRFLADGTRVFGPAPRGMDRLPLELVGGEVRIDFSRIELGPCSDGVRFRSGRCPYSTADETKYERARWPGAN